MGFFGIMLLLFLTSFVIIGEQVANTLDCTDDLIALTMIALTMIALTMIAPQ